MSEDQPKQINSEQPQTEAISQETTENPSMISETQPPEQPISDNESVVAKPQLWQQVLGLVRSLLPQSLNKNLSDNFLSVAVTGIFALILVVIFVSISPSQDIPVVAEYELNEETPAPESLSSTIDSKNPQLSETALQEALESTEPIITPPPELTPEQTFLVSIQNQIDDLANQYAGGIIKSLKFYLSTNLLMAELSNDWYNMTQEEQNKLVNQMFEEVQDLDFKKLILINSQGRTIARTSVINSYMIILERSLLKLPESFDGKE